MQIAVVVYQLVLKKQAQVQFELIQNQFAPCEPTGFDVPHQISFCDQCGRGKFYSWDTCKCFYEVTLPKKTAKPKVSLKKLNSRPVRSNIDDSFEYKNYKRSTF